MKSKHVVVYMGGGIWKDVKGELWGKSNNPSVEQSRQYETDKDQDGFLEDRGDIAFMVKYGQMNVNTISLGEPETGSKDTDNSDAQQDANDMKKEASTPTVPVKPQVTPVTVKPITPAK